MKNAIDFVRFALSHAKRETIPAGAQIPLDIEECGTSPWEYLFGTTGNIVHSGKQRKNDPCGLCLRLFER